MMELEKDNVINLDDVDFRGVARAYKIIYFYSIGKSWILELLFGSDEGEELESWTEDPDKKIDPELEQRYRQWLEENMHRREVDIALRMVFGEITGNSAPGEPVEAIA